MLNELKCEAVSINKIQTLKYNESQLSKYFINYLKCAGDSVSLKSNAAIRTSNKTRIRITSGIFSITNTSAYRIGAEFEFGMFTRNKWALLIDANYLIFYSGYTGINTLALPLGIRHYFYLNNDTRLFLNAFLLTTYYSPGSTRVFDVGNPAFGGGIAYKRLSIRGESIVQFWARNHVPNYSVILSYDITKK